MFLNAATGYPSIQYLKITSESKKWRDLSISEQKHQETQAIIKRVCVAIAIISLLGAIASFGYLLPTAIKTGTGAHYSVYIITGSISLMGVIMSFAKLDSMQIENNEKAGDKRAKENSKFLDNMVFKLKDYSFKRLYNDFHQMGWVVRNGILTINEAHEIKKLYQDYSAEIRRERKTKEEKIQYPALYANRQSMENTNFQDIEARWDQLRLKLEIFQKNPELIPILENK